MSSILKVDEIQNAAGTTGLTIDSSGRVVMPNRPAFHVTGFGQAKASSWQKVTFSGTPTINRGSHYDQPTSKFTAPINGLYVFNTGGYIGANNNPERYAFAFYHNGAASGVISGGTQPSVDAPLEAFSQLIDLQATDYIEVYMYTPNAETLGSSNHPMWFQGYLLG